MYKIIVTPSKNLIKMSSPVQKFDKKLKKIVKEMSETLDATVDPVGVGLAAPQVGIAKRIFLAKPQEKGKTLVFINPEIIEASEGEEIPILPNSAKVELMKKMAEKKKTRPGRKGKLLEGCLSVPNIWGNVSRKKDIKVKYWDLDGRQHVEDFKGFPAIIIQHELDHLNGILFTKHVLSQGEKLYRSYKNEEGEDEFEEIEV
jgi:peptide deformylase